MRHEARSHVVGPPHPIGRLIDELAELLPAQGPISVFIHHNTLHIFEHLPFEEAVELAAARLGCEPFLAEARYRDKLASGRILAADVERALHEQLGAGGAEDVAGIASRFALWRAVVLHGVPEAAGQELSWILDETTVLSRFRTDVPAGARAASAGLAEPDARPERRGARRAPPVERLPRSRQPRRSGAGPGDEDARSTPRLAAGRARPRHRRLVPSIADPVPRRLPRPGSRAVAHARAGPRHSRLLPGGLRHGAGDPVRPLGPKPPASRRRRPPRRARCARLDRPLARPPRGRRRRARGVPGRRAAGAAGMGRHRAPDRRAARPRAGT